MLVDCKILSAPASYAVRISVSEDGQIMKALEPGADMQRPLSAEQHRRTDLCVCDGPFDDRVGTSELAKGLFSQAERLISAVGRLRFKRYRVCDGCSKLQVAITIVPDE